MKTRPIITVTSDEYLIHRKEYDGLCLACGEIQFGDVESDAENYMCESCGKAKVFGFEKAMMLGYVVLVFIGEERPTRPTRPTPDCDCPAGGFCLAPDHPGPRATRAPKHPDTVDLNFPNRVTES
jgi:hypothetical protein